MAADNQTILVGNLAADPDLKYTPNGTAIAKLRLAVNERIRTANGWEDGDTSFFDVIAWKALGEHAAESLHKGDRTIVSGRWRTRTYQTDQGDKRTAVELHADEIGPSLKFAIVRDLTRARERTTGDEPPFEHDHTRAGGRSL